jgi:predicted enzyme related to lactoylglutathione lyase
MAKVLGLGGIFFKARDPRALMAWYQAHLGMPTESADYANLFPGTMPAGGCTVFSPFEADTRYFAPSTSSFMVNLIVDDLDGALRQVRLGGGRQVGEIKNFEYGRFGWFLDPENNKVELWEPFAPAPTVATP